MQQYLNYVTLAVADLDRSRAFYVEGLGWEPSFEAPGEVVFLPVGGAWSCRCGIARRSKQKSVSHQRGWRR